MFSREGSFTTRARGERARVAKLPSRLNAFESPMYSPLARPRPVRELIAESPLVPVALAATLGLIADRYLHFPVAIEALALVAGLAGWIAMRRQPARGLIAAWIAAG